MPREPRREPSQLVTVAVRDLVDVSMLWRSVWMTDVWRVITVAEMAVAKRRMFLMESILITVDRPNEQNF